MNHAITALLDWVDKHLDLLSMGFLGACLGFLLSQEDRRTRIIGWLSGMILCIALSQTTADILANGTHVEIFAFFWGSIGKSTAESLLTMVRVKLLNQVEKETNQ